MRHSRDAQDARDRSAADQERLLTLYGQGRLDEAALLAGRLAKAYPDDPFVWKARGTVLLTGDQAQAAIPPLEKAVALARDDPQARHTPGKALERSGPPGEAAAQDAVLVRLQPENATAQYDLANMFQALGQLA